MHNCAEELLSVVPKPTSAQKDFYTYLALTACGQLLKSNYIVGISFTEILSVVIS